MYRVDSVIGGNILRSGASPNTLTGSECLLKLFGYDIQTGRSGGLEGGDSSSVSDLENDEPQKHRKLQPKDMPWHNRRGEPSVSANPSCMKSANIIRRFCKDIKSAKLYIHLAPGTPQGIPMSECEHISKGEAVDLDKILSSLHCMSIDPERKAHVGDTEISIGGVEMKRKVETSSEWSMTWRSALQAVAFAFDHQERELAKYGDYIEQLFAAKQPGSHNQVILFNKGVRNKVGGGQSLVLMDYQYFASLYTATMQDNRVEYRWAKCL